MNINHLIKKNILLFTVVAFSSSAFAQIEEIVVTARKKSESLQDIPVQVDVLTSEEILYLIVVYDLFNKCVSTCLFATNHLNHFRVLTTSSGLQRCHCLLSHAF